MGIRVSFQILYNCFTFRNFFVLNFLVLFTRSRCLRIVVDSKFFFFSFEVTYHFIFTSIMIHTTLIKMTVALLIIQAKLGDFMQRIKCLFSLFHFNRILYRNQLRESAPRLFFSRLWISLPNMVSKAANWVAVNLLLSHVRNDVKYTNVERICSYFIW